MNLLYRQKQGNKQRKLRKKVPVPSP